MQLHSPPRSATKPLENSWHHWNAQHKKRSRRVSSASWDVFPQLNLKDWMVSIDLALDTMGLLLCGDPTAAFQGMAYLVNKHVQMTDHTIANFVIAPRSEKLLQNFLSTRWDKFMDAIS
jgi:hypothetical protein